MPDRRMTDDAMTMRTFAIFIGMTFAMTWGLGALLFMAPDLVQAVFGPVSYSNPLFILAVYSPGISAVILVLFHTGPRGLVRFLHRLTLWRMPWPWWLFLIVGVPAMFYAGAAIKGTIGDPLPFSPWHSIFPALLLALLVGPIEEFGWRGLALPLLQRRLSPFWAAIVLGVIWATWHIPAFFVSGTPQSAWSFPAFFIGVVAISVIITPMFNAARGSLLIPMLMHFQTNGPAWPDAQPWDSAVFVAAAVVIVWLNRQTMFRSRCGATAVLSPVKDTPREGATVPFSKQSLSANGAVPSRPGRSRGSI